MNEPVVAATKPKLVTLKQGRPYLWCTCGRSQQQPFCDNSHAGTGFEPLRFKPERSGDFLLCQCKHTGDAPYCDGSHNNLGDGYEEASEEEIAASAHFPVTPRDGVEVGKALLDGGCYVRTVDPDALRQQGNIAWSPMIAPEDGANCLALYYLEARDSSDSGADRAIMAFPGSHVALFVLEGEGEIHISGRTFPVGAEQGVYIGADEAFSIEPSTGSGTLRTTITICPQCEEPRWLDQMPENFNAELDERVFAFDPAKREPMADRFYQVLIDDNTGGADMTQFLGEVPKSRAAGHHHLYEETITILSGEGYMWTEGARAAVKPGDVIFLPRRQQHSLECTSEGGMRLVGVFFPAGSPAVNY
ncbi:CDGSH iron-sulfur domain-containing protein [Elongatibacter sediminis]|uniref:CDGSH iron-sulfur domain-containing protein n=1 Tax=Elongatibacter sediminis TaxID=3119006 RepID=A0AAW9RI07_9GAMM